MLAEKKGTSINAIIRESIERLFNPDKLINTTYFDIHG
jgi:hypothetical protein